MTDLARAAGISPSLVGRWIAGQAKPTVDTLRPVADALGRPLAEVLVSAGILKPGEVEIQLVTNAEGLTDEQLLAEVGRRIKTGARAAPTLEQVAAEPGRYEVIAPEKPTRGRRRTSE